VILAELERLVASQESAIASNSAGGLPFVENPPFSTSVTLAFVSGWGSLPRSPSIATSSSRGTPPGPPALQARALVPTIPSFALAF
jgi:hypothetical protein